MLRRIAGAGAAAGFAATLLVGGAQGAQAATPIQIVNANTGNTCLTLKTIDGFKGQVTTANCQTGNESQVWVVAGGIIRSPRWGHCLDGNGADVYTFPCTANDEYQKWTTTSGDKKWIRHEWSKKYLNSSGSHNEHVGFTAQTSACRWFWRNV
ncbi:hypothetical protein UK23_24825 [Lentzea aerocolonigenes]|uniref:Ricin B lectin domain-containing protein n=2 Tax=Lentzea aerocolonigenes TaxID=68170 RepID=A0A0F0GQP8_LENAE|nr:hypothetical protein UK23_24825 [Lentzea aerocolonigenes]